MFSLLISNHHLNHFHLARVSPTRAGAAKCLSAGSAGVSAGFGESFPSFTKSAVCWQFCWQLQLGSSQLIDAQASEMVAGGGIEPPTQGFSVLCSTN
jgi:hypothetical protein